MRQFTDGDFPFGAEFTAALRDGFSKTLVVSGCDVTVNTGNLGASDTLSAASGSVQIDGSTVSISSQNVQLDAADSFKRYDLVVAGTDGVVEAVKGTSEKIAEKIPASHVLLAIWEVPADASTVGSANKFDSRVLHGPFKGINYIQSTAPSYIAGGTWLDPDTGVLYGGWDAGNGGGWHPTTPVIERDEATAFDGSDGETVTKDSTFTTSGSISLGSPYQIDGFEHQETFDVLGTVPQSASSVTGVEVKPDGTKIWAVGYHYVWEFSLSTAWDLSTASHTATLDYSTEDKLLEDMEFKDGDGTTMFLIGRRDNTIREFSLSTAYDLSTASEQSSQQTPENHTTQGFTFKPDGTKLYVVENDENNIEEYDLSTAWDITTMSLNQQFSTSLSQEEGVHWKPDGTRLFLTDGSNNNIHRWDASTPWDVSSLSKDGNTGNLNELSDIAGFRYEDSGWRFYVGGASDGDLLHYAAGFTSGDALVGWSEGVPTDIKEWLDAGFQVTANQGTVTVDVEDASGTVLESDIETGYPLDTDPDVDNTKDIKLRFNLSRSALSDTSPVVDYAFRRNTR